MAKRFLGWMVAAVAAGCAAEPAVQEAETPAVEVTLSGAVAKGPFLLGSSVAITPAAMRANENSAVATTSGAARASGVPADPRGDAKGQVFRTETANDLGEFELQVAYQGGALIEASGFYYNEFGGTLSGAPLTLRAFHEIGTTNTTVQVNLITHLTYQRVQALVADGATAGEAQEQAEGELGTALGLGQGPMKAGSEISLIAGDDDASAYLFAVSTVFTAAGRTDAGIQELLNTTAAAFATAGKIPEQTKAQLETARLRIDNARVEAAFAARLAATGSTAEVPDLDRVIPWTIPTAVQACADAMPSSIASACRLAVCGNNSRGGDPRTLANLQEQMSSCDEACWAKVTCSKDCNIARNLSIANNHSGVPDPNSSHDALNACIETCGIDSAESFEIQERAEVVINTSACN